MSHMLIFIAFLFVLLAVSITAFRLMIASNANSGAKLEQLLSGESLADRYRPMERLLRSSDWAYLSKQPGFTPAKIRKIRSQRRGIFRQYLAGMNGDFSALCLLVRALMVQSPVDRSDLASALGGIQRAYYSSVIKIQVKLVAQAIGVSSAEIDTTALTRVLERLAEEARSLSASESPVFA